MFTIKVRFNGKVRFTINSLLKVFMILVAEWPCCDHQQDYVYIFHMPIYQKK